MCSLRYKITFVEIFDFENGQGVNLTIARKSVGRLNQIDSSPIKSQLVVQIWYVVVACS